MKIILNLAEGSDGEIALRAARELLRDGYDECVYRYGEHFIFARRTKTGVSARESRR